MKRQLQDQLYKDFPLLYGDRNKSMRQTCMCWGIETGDGWYDLIRELSEKLSKQIEQYSKDNPNLRCYNCGCTRDKHYASRSYNPGKCLHVRREPRKRYFLRTRRLPWYRRLINPFLRLLNFFYSVFSYDLMTCHCEGYEPNIPRASQVKEKYGTLRFYMTSELPGMHEHIMEAERKSAETCEVCGAPGKVIDGGWIATRCEDCLEK